MRKFLPILILLAWASVASAQEADLHLTVPITQPTTAVSDYLPVSLHLQVRPTPTIVIRIQGTDGRIETFNYPCAITTPQYCTYTTDASVLGLINALNTTNLATRSLWRLVMDRLVADFPTFFVGGATVQ